MNEKNWLDMIVKTRIWDKVVKDNSTWYVDYDDYTKDYEFQKEYMCDFEEKAKSAPVETDEQKVIRILKGDFEKKFGMTFEKFIEVRETILEHNPEKLI